MITLLALLTMPTPSSGQSGVLPVTLREHAQSIGCGPVAEYYDAPSRRDPPYAFGYRSADDDKSAVYWCEPGLRRAKSRLVIWFDADLGAPPCQPLSWDNPARGVLLVRESRTLSEFSYVDPPRRRGPAGEQTTNPIIRSSYDGITNDFYCYGGQWLVRRLD